MADNPSNIVPDNLIVVEGDAGFVPKAEPSDAGKVLKVDSQGTPVWGEDSGGTSFEPDKGLELTGGKLSVKTYYGLTNNMNGEGLVGIVPGDSTLSVNNAGIRVTNPLPASTSADEDKVLTVDSNGNPAWATAQGGGGAAVSGSYVVNADPAFTSVSPITPTTVGSTHIYYELADSTETRQIAAIEIPRIILPLDSNWSQVSEIQQNLSTSKVSISLYKLNTSTNTLTIIAGLAIGRYAQRTTNSSSYPYFWVDVNHLLYVPSNPLPVLSENEKYVITVYSTVGNPSSYIYPTRISTGYKVNVYYSSASDKVVFNPVVFPDVNAPLRVEYDVLKLDTDPSKGFFVQTNDNQYNNTLSIRNQDVDKNLGYDPQNPEGYVRYVSLKDVENATSEWGDQNTRFPAPRAYLESSDPMTANPSSYNVSYQWQLNQGNRGNVYIVHFEIPMTSSGNTDANCICKFYLQDREEDWETMQQTTYYHYFTLFGQYIASEQMAVFDGAITVPETKGMPENQYWSPTVTPLDSGTTLTVDSTRSPRYCWSFI